MIIITQLPFVGTLIISFLRWNALDPSSAGFAGLGNYIAVATDARAALVDGVHGDPDTVSVVVVSLLLGLAWPCCWTGSSAAAASCGRC